MDVSKMFQFSQFSQFSHDDHRSIMAETGISAGIIDIKKFRCTL